MTYSNCKTVHNFADDISEDWKEIITNIENNESDFSVGDYRWLWSSLFKL